MRATVNFQILAIFLTMGGHHGSNAAGRSAVSCPVYSHLTYDIVPGEALVIDRPDVVILEGLNVLQTVSDARRDPPVFVSDFVDFSIYVDAPEHAARRWYIERVLLLRATAFKESASDFHRYAALSNEAAEQVAGESWDAINGPNSERTSCRRASAPTSS